MDSLTLISTDDLIEELLTRGTACVISMSRPIDGEPDSDHLVVRRYGNWATQYGLANYALLEMNRDFDTFGDD